MDLSAKKMVDELVQFPLSGSFCYMAAVNVLLSLIGLGALQILHDFITQSLPHCGLHAITNTHTHMLTMHCVQNKHLTHKRGMAVRNGGRGQQHSP